MYVLCSSDVTISIGCFYANAQRLLFRRSPNYNSKNLNCIGALSFFKICSHISVILKSNWSSDFGHTETGSGAKSK